MAANALAGVKIADFTWVVAGPLTIKHLADHGAEVIHIESSIRPELLRLLPPFKDREPGLNRSAYNACVNNNKYGLSLNMNHPRVKEVLHRLIHWADVVAENFAPGTMAKWGLAYEDLIKIKPDIIMFSTSQMGQTGPRAKIAAYGAQLVSLAGFSFLTGWPDRDPTGPYGPYTDAAIPPLGTAAILTALIHRRRTGKGKHIDISQFEAALNFISPVLLDYAVNHRVTMRNGNRCATSSPHGSTVVVARIDGALLPYLAMRNGKNFARLWTGPNLQRFLDLLLFNRERRTRMRSTASSRSGRLDGFPRR